MFIVLLKFSINKTSANDYMESHMAWLKRGFDDGVFILAGSLLPDLGGSVMAHKTTAAELKKRVGEDPFVQENVVKAEIIEIKPAKTDPRLEFLQE